MSNSTEQSFRSNLSQFRWAQSNNADSQQDAAGPPQGRFARFYNAIGGGYIPLRSNERSNDEEAYFALSRWERYGSFSAVCGATDGYSCDVAHAVRGDSSGCNCVDRLLGFGGCLIGAAVCFFVAFLTLPMLAIRPAKFALAFRYVATLLLSFVI